MPAGGNLGLCWWASSVFIGYAFGSRVGRQYIWSILVVDKSDISSSNTMLFGTTLDMINSPLESRHISPADETDIGTRGWFCDCMTCS